MINYIRKLAKQRDSQLIYNSSKEIEGIRLFFNCIDFTYAQKLYLMFLNLYSSIYTDLALKKVSEKVLENEIYEDSYFVFKDKSEEKKEEKSTKPHDVHLVVDNPKKKAKKNG